jgi:predicted ribosomally synthesized peptide with SipW-like signal peptide
MHIVINTKILLSGATILAAAAIIIGATYAFFSDTETSQDNTLAAGALDLKIDNTSYYNGVLNPGTTWTLDDLTDQLFFDFTDVKPNDLGEDTISVHAENDSWVCADFTLTENNDNTCTTPELTDDPTCTDPNAPGNTNLFDGELAQNIEFAFWTDDGDNVLEDDEEVIASGSAQDVLNSSIVLADSQTNNLGGSDGDPMTGGDNHYIAKAWCFGTLTQNPLPQGQGDPTVDGGVTCDGTLLDNSTQSDKVLADITFTAVQSRNNPDFVCEETPPQISCTENDVIYAGSFSDNDQGLRKDGSGVLANRSVPSAAFGAPETSGADSDAGFPTGSFFSLGFPLSGNTASIVFGFAEPFFPNPSGADLQVFEVTGGVYPDEKVKVEVATSAGGPWSVATPNPGTRDAGFEIPLASAQFVRLTESSNIALFEPEADGYDVDAVKAFCTEVNQ